MRRDFGHGQKAVVNTAPYLHNLAHSPSVEPDSPRFVRGTCISSERAVCSLESPEEKRVVRVVWTVDSDVSSEVPVERERDIWK